MNVRACSAFADAATARYGRRNVKYAPSIIGKQAVSGRGPIDIRNPRRRRKNSAHRLHAVAPCTA